MPSKSEKVLYEEFIEKEAKRMLKGNPSLPMMILAGLFGGMGMGQGGQQNAA